MDDEDKSVFWYYEICPFRAYQRSFRLFHGNFSKDIHLRSRLLCFTHNDHTGQTEFKICPFLKWGHIFILIYIYFIYSVYEHFVKNSIYARLIYDVSARDL